MNPRQTQPSLERGTSKKQSVVRSILPLACLLLLTTVDLPATPRIIVMTGDPVPVADGTFNGGFSSGMTALNDESQIAFIGGISSASATIGVFSGNATSITTLILQGQPAPDGNGVFSNPRDGVLSLNGSGVVAFRAQYSETSGGSLDNSCVLRLDGTTTVLIARSNQNSPDGNGKVGDPSTPVINGDGRVYFRTAMRETSGGATDNSALFYGAGSTLTVVARKGQNAPGGNGKLGEFFSSLVINNAGQTAFSAGLTATAGGTADNAGLFRFQDATGISLIRKGQATPSGNGAFSGFGSLRLSESGTVAFIGSLSGASGGADEGVFVADELTVTEVVRNSDFVPGTTDPLNLLSVDGINSSNHVIVTASAIGDKVILFWDGASLATIARSGDPAPDGSGSISQLGESASVFGGPAINDRGQIAFFARLTGTAGGSSDDLAIYVHDPQRGMVEVARKGRSFLDGTIVDIRAIFGTLDPSMYSFNNRGQVSFYFELADGRRGIAVWSPPDDSPKFEIRILEDNLTLAFRGAPFREYQFQATDNLGTDFVDLEGTDTADADGVVTREETFDPGASRRFFRTREVE